MVLFATGVGDFRSGVLYLHGSATGKTDTTADIVLTESQYQQQYASNDVIARDRREAYGLIFSANSILFVGTGLEEDDVLRPLRQFVSDNDIASRHRPWFALIEGPQDYGRRNEIFHRYYYRYGIRVIFVDRHSGNHGEDLIKKVAEIKEGWTAYRRERTAIPRARIPRFRPVVSNGSRQVVAHHATVQDSRQLAPVAHATSCLVGGHNRRSYFILGQQGRGKGQTKYDISQLPSSPGTKMVDFLQLHTSLTNFSQ